MARSRRSLAVSISPRDFALRDPDAPHRLGRRSAEREGGSRGSLTAFARIGLASVDLAHEAFDWSRQRQQDQLAGFYESMPLPTLFTNVALFGIVAGLILLALSPRIKRLMGEVN